MSELLPVYLEHAGTVLTGQAAMPKGKGPFPAVMVMHNALGLGSHVRDVARRLAGLGYVAVATDMYGGGVAVGDSAMSGVTFEALTNNPAFLRERVTAWFDRVSGMVEVSKGRVAAVGFCFGGTCVLELARCGLPARAVVSYHGILSTANPMPRKAFAGEVAAFCGGRDPYAPLDHIDDLRAEMVSADVRHTITVYGDAEHGFTDPDADSLGRDGISYHALADRLSWATTVELLDAALRS